MALTVRYSKGVVVEYGGQRVVFDPTSDSHEYPVFVSHAHADHAAAFKYPDMVKHATEPTYRLLENLRWKRLRNWRPMSIGERVKVGDIEVRAHNAGHVLGSTQFEVITPEGTLLYSGDFAMGNSYTMDAASTMGCDLLVVETTFGAPMFRFPKRKDVALDMVKWATMEAIPQGRTPAIKTDSIGNAQEVISLFNRMTKLPVVTSKSATRVSDVYRQYGHILDYVDADSPEGQELLEGGRCVIVAPKGAKLTGENIESALASGWAVLWKRRGRAFALSDHADFRELLGFIRRCHPKRVFTFHGSPMTRGFADYVKKRLGIDAKRLTGREEALMGTVSRGEMRMKACYDQLMRTVRIPGFEYNSPWLVKEMAKRGFTRSETEAALHYLKERGVLVATSNGVKLV